MELVNNLWRRLHRTPNTLARSIVLATTAFVSLLFSFLGEAVGLGAYASLPPVAAFVGGWKMLDMLNKMQCARFEEGGISVRNRNIPYFHGGAPMLYPYVIWVRIWFWQTFLASTAAGLAMTVVLVWIA